MQQTQAAKGKWARMDFRNLDLSNNTHASAEQRANKRASGFRESREVYTPDQAWVLVRRYMRAGSLVAAWGGGDMDVRAGSGGVGGDGGRRPMPKSAAQREFRYSKASRGERLLTDPLPKVEPPKGMDGPAGGGGLNGESLTSNGLVALHAYSVLDARELGLLKGTSLASGVLGRTRLVRLRNPWGSYEWKGAWSDGSEEWARHPMVKARLRPKPADDGTFWMSWEDFSRLFRFVDVCDRTTRRDLRLRVHEDLGPLGVVWGCLCGLGAYILCCLGVRVAYCGHASSAQTRSAQRTCCCLPV
jgi:hypothetical protein